MAMERNVNGPIFPDCTCSSNLTIAEKPPRKASLFSALIFIKYKKMCFDIDVEKYSLEALRETLARIVSLLNKPSVVARLPDQGLQLRLSKLKLQKEIKFRESLNVTHGKMQKLSLKCASEANIADLHGARLCSLERNPRQRFKPNLTFRYVPSGRTESLQELRSAQMLDLETSLVLQKQQDERVKIQQMRAKQERLAKTSVATGEEEPLSETDSQEVTFETSDEDLEIFDAVEDGEELFKVVKNYIFNGPNANGTEEMNYDQPGPSGVKTAMKTKQEGKREQIGSSDDSDDMDTPAAQGVEPMGGNLYYQVKKESKKTAAPDMGGPSGVKRARMSPDDEDETKPDSALEDMD